MDLKLKNNSLLTLPTRYIPVDYIESVGNPNIPLFSLSLWSSDGQSIECSIEVTEEEASSSKIYYGDNNSQKFGLVANNSVIQFNAYGNAVVKTVEFNGKVTIKHSVTNITINDVSTSLGDTVAKVPTIYLLPQAIKTRIYYFNRIVKNNISVNYIPVISLEYGHVGEACLYDTISQTFKYPSSTGSFTASLSQTFYDTISSAYIKDCPNIDGITILRDALNLNRVRCNINNPTGHTTEIYKYAQLSGFNDAGEQQTKPRIVGIFNIDDYYTDAEVAEIRSKIDGITIVTPITSDYNVDTLLNNNEFAVQTIDENKPEYNQPVAEVLASANLAHSLASDDTKMFMTKTEAAAITSLPVTLFRANTDIESFDEFKYWTGLTTITAGSSSSVLGAFGGCTSLQRIIIPENITSVGAYAFYGCSNLTSAIDIKDASTSTYSFAYTNISKLKVKTLGDLSVYRNYNINELLIKSSASNYSICSSGKSDGVCIIEGNLNSSGAYAEGTQNHRFGKYIIKGNFTVSHGTSTVRRCMFGTGSVIKEIRIQGNVVTSSTDYGIIYVSSSQLAFLEICGTFTNAFGGTNAVSYWYAANAIIHLGSNSVGGLASHIIKETTRLNMVYVGDGSSRANDEAVLALYLADTNWSTYSAKLATWYDYNGEYKWYYITDNLTDCTNTNPDEWPHITRGESYETTIVADEGMTIDSVTVEMLDTDTTSPTYDTMVDITSSVYDSSTGEINIPSVTGNVIITASAS